MRRFSGWTWIARGSTGLVFQAFDRVSNQRVAIKRADKPDSEQGMPVATLREAAMFRTLRHTNIVTLYDIIMTSSAVYLVLELCSCNLRQHLHEQQDTGLRTTEPHALCRTASHIFSALAYLHELQIIHRWAQYFTLTKIHPVMQHILEH